MTTDTSYTNLTLSALGNLIVRLAENPVSHFPPILSVINNGARYDLIVTVR